MNPTIGIITISDTIMNITSVGSIVITVDGIMAIGKTATGTVDG